VPGSFTLLSGEPGIGKSTLTLQIADWIAASGQQVLYVSGEEGEAQIADRAHRLDVKNQDVFFLHEHCLEDIIATLDAQTFPLVIIDSVSVLYSDRHTGSIG
jgi:DNA repair protein RadA/Sms